MAQTVQEWYSSLPAFTRHYFTAVVAITLLTTLGIIPVRYIILDWNAVFQQFQIWRLVTCFLFFGGFGLPWFFQMWLLVTYFGHLERGYYSGNRGLAELLFLVVFGAVAMLLLSYLLGGLYILSPALVFMALYVWSRKDPYQDVMFWGFRFLAWHFPFVMLILGTLLSGGSPPIHDVIGILVGHLYHFMDDIVPKRYGVTVLRTPRFFYDLVEKGLASAANPAAPAWQRTRGYRMQ